MVFNTTFNNISVISRRLWDLTDLNDLFRQQCCQALDFKNTEIIDTKSYTAVFPGLDEDETRINSKIARLKACINLFLKINNILETVDTWW